MKIENDGLGLFNVIVSKILSKSSVSFIAFVKVEINDFCSSFLIFFYLFLMAFTF
jgi:hypothetical protein